MSHAVPTATGSLEITPFGHLLVYALDHVLTGTLVLEQEDGSKHAVFFSDGAPAKAKTATPVVFLSEILMERGLLSPSVMQRTVETAVHDRRLHGELLVREGLVDAQTLRAALREQLARQILWMFKLPPSTAYGYYDRIDFLERWGAPEGVRVKPLDLIWRGLREFTRSEEIEERLHKLGDGPIRLHMDAPIRRFHFAPREQAVIDVLRARPQPLAELLRRGLGSDAEVKRLVYGLLITRQLDTGVSGIEPIGVDEAPSSSRMPVAPRAVQTPRPASFEISSSPPPPAQASARPAATAPLAAPDAPAPAVSSARPPAAPELEAFKQELERLAARDDETHYQVLGVDEGAPQEAVRAAFYALAKKWHPDRLAPELASLKELATRVFARMTEAQQVLIDPALRQEYDRRLKQTPNADEVEHVQRVLRATTAYRKAEVLLKRNNLVAAEQEARIAVESDPSQADHLALYAWLQALKPEPNLAELLKTMDRAVDMEPNNVRVRWHRGQLLKRMQRPNRAVQDFRFIVEKDPRHLDAQREIRLYEMRRPHPSNQPGRRSSQPPPKPSDSGGLLGKLFKKS